MTTKLGHHYADLSDYTEGDVYYDEVYEMTYRTYTAHPMTPVAYRGGIVATDHDGVGMVTYFGFDTRAERLAFIPSTADYIDA